MGARSIAAHLCYRAKLEHHHASGQEWLQAIESAP
jgi:hypothetical protein